MSDEAFVGTHFVCKNGSTSLTGLQVIIWFKVVHDEVDVRHCVGGIMQKLSFGAYTFVGFIRSVMAIKVSGYLFVAVYSSRIRLKSSLSLY